jgi:hypothetical protein
MEPNKLKKSSAFGLKVLALTALIFAPGSQLYAAGHNSITAGEIAMYVAIIVVVIGVAWFFASRQTDKLDKEHHEQMSHQPPKKHYDHPNDPHFRKLR